MAAGGETRNPSLRLEQQVGGGSSQRAGDVAQHVEAGQIFVGFKIAEHLPGNLGMAEAVHSAVRELVEGQPELLPMAANNPHQRHVFRQPVPTFHRRPQLNSRPLIFHKSKIAPPDGTKNVPAARPLFNFRTAVK